MDITWIVVIIVLVLGVIIGNITLLKYSAKFKFPTPSKPFDDENNKTQSDKNGNTPKKHNGFEDEEEW